LRDDPAAGEFVEEDDAVTVVIGFAAAAETAGDENE